MVQEEPMDFGGTNIDILRRKVYGFPPDATDEEFEDEQLYPLLSF